MVTDQTLTRIIAEKLIRERNENIAKHEPSGKLTASMLGKPLQWQILKIIGVPMKELDEYVLRKFQRGEHVEEYIIKYLPALLETQKRIEYNGVIGYADSVIDTSEYECKLGVMCNEVKSVTNASFNWINKDKQPKYGHSLQGAIYGLGLNHKYFMITYVASDDYRIWSVVQETVKYKKDIDLIIEKFNEAMKKKIVPVFEAIEEWQKKPDYSDYPDWMLLNQGQINKKLLEYKVKWTPEK